MKDKSKELTDYQIDMINMIKKELLLVNETLSDLRKLEDEYIDKGLLSVGITHIEIGYDLIIRALSEPSIPWKGNYENRIQN